MRAILIVAASSLFALPAAAIGASVDRDHDRLPDRWEARYHLPSSRAGGPQGDIERDGVKNLTEYRRGCSPRRADTDRDRMPDRFEVRFKLNCHSKRDAGRDADHDRLSNLKEYRAGTNPRRPDSDGDALIDGADNCPLVRNRGQENTYGDSRGDACEAKPAPGAGGGTGTGGGTGGGSGGGVFTPTPGVDLEVTKTGDKETLNPGEQLTYTVTVRNLGAASATDVSLADQLPVTARPDDEFGNPQPPRRDVTATGPPSTSQGSCTAVDSVNNQFTCSLGTIASGASVVVQLIVQAQCPTNANGMLMDTKTVTNSATAGTSASDTNGSNNTGQKSVTISKGACG